ncbi:hypothetical protein CRE_05079 [Caenorhabditis remanei]|uniref:Uncharacterized protein n=1 Tax=Caenorhabditis remanei TaxID=31234 RepID=E3MZ27_CAERE|nr:hypothetical protein CRE_05079 [Caenorhabditis remanei]
MSDNPHPNLMNMPEFFLKSILNKLDVQSVQTMRKVSPTFRYYVDHSRLDSRILKISVFLQSPEKISLDLKTANDLFEIEYLKNGENGCFVKYRNTSKEVTCQNIATTLGNDLGLILKKQLSVVKEFSLMCNENCLTTTCDEFVGALSGKLAERESPFKLKTLSWEGSIDEGQIMPLLSHCDRIHINKIELQRLNKSSELRPLLGVEEILNSPQWGRIKTFEAVGFVVANQMRHFTHLTSANFLIETVTTEDIMTLRQTALQTTRFNEFSFSYVNFTDETQLFGLFGQPHRTEHMKNKWIYKYPGGRDALLVIWETNRFKFSHIHPRSFDKFGIPKHDLVVL